MRRNLTLHFKIDAFTPDNLPMAHLAEYMADLAEVLGEQTKVHFVELKPGSTDIVHRIDASAVSAVQSRVQAAKSDDAPDDIRKAYRNVNKRLRHDNASAKLFTGNRNVLLKFPGIEERTEATYGAFKQDDVLEGVLWKIGGKADAVRVLIRGREQDWYCYAKVDVARDLAKHFRGPELRVMGTGRWLRNDSGEWSLERFKIRSFDVLDDQPLSTVVAKLRDVPGSGWDDIEDASEELSRIRSGHREGK